MEETLGKRIVAHRKRVRLTQDKLAEALGITAQAVSKWENDQSCPDITMLPKLAEVFGVSTDELLGLEKKDIHIAEMVTEQEEANPEGLRMESENGTWELKWDGGRKSSLGTALWLLLTGGLAMVCAFLDHGASLWHLAWSSGLLIFGLFGLFPKFSFFRLGCTFFGGYFLLFHMDVLPFYLEWEFILPTLLLLFGLSLLGDALRKPQKGSFHIAHNGKTLGGSGQNYCSYDGESFDCSTSFGENDYPIQLSRLSGGQANVSFGQLTVDLTGCEELAEDCTLELNCSFGALILMVPRSFRAEIANNTAFGAVEVKGSPAPDTEHTVALVCNVSFGQITIRYV